MQRRKNTAQVRSTQAPFSKAPYLPSYLPTFPWHPSHASDLDSESESDDIEAPTIKLGPSQVRGIPFTRSFSSCAALIALEKDNHYNATC